MNRTFITKSKEEWLRLRAEDLTSTDIAALFDISPYLSKFELWHRKKNRTVGEMLETERMKWGNRLQESIATGIAKDNGWIIDGINGGKLDNFYQRIEELKIGSSYDYFVSGPDIERSILEIKNVDSLAFKEGWEVSEDAVEAPLHIELQVQYQLLVSGLKKAYIGALIGGNRVVLIERKADSAVHNSIIQKAAEFWKSIKDCEEPAPDFKRDASFIKSLYQAVSPEKTIQANERIEELVKRYKVAADEAKAAEEEKDAFKAELLTLIGDAEKVKGEGFSISANLVGPCHVEYERAGYRNMKITYKKEKPNA